MVFGPAGLYPREVYPDQPPNRATIQENQAKLPGGYGFFSFSVRPSSFVLSAVSAGSSAGSRASAELVGLAVRPITICIIRTAAINAPQPVSPNLAPPSPATHRSAWRRILPFGRPAQWSISGDTSGRSPALYNSRYLMRGQQPQCSGSTRAACRPRHIDNKHIHTRRSLLSAVAGRRNDTRPNRSADTPRARGGRLVGQDNRLAMPLRHTSIAANSRAHQQASGPEPRASEDARLGTTGELLVDVALTIGTTVTHAASSTSAASSVASSNGGIPGLDRALFGGVDLAGAMRT